MDSELGSIDFLQYWAAAQLLGQGQNPYDPELIGVVESHTHVAAEHLPVLLWNPPLIFPFIFWLKWLEFDQARQLWVGLQVGMYALSLLALRVVITRESSAVMRKIISPCFFIFALLFYPFALSLYYGQLSPLLLLSLSFGLLFLARGAERRAGAALAITFLKPHLLFLLYGAVALDALRTTKARKVAQGMIAAAVFLAISVLVLAPRGFAWYAESLSAPPIYWQTPTLGSWLQRITDMHLLPVRLIPTLLCVVALVVYWSISKAELLSKEKLFLLIIPASLLFSPYGWVYDQLLLLPSIGWIGRLSLERRAQGEARWNHPLALILFAAFLLLLTPSEWGQQGGVFMPLAVLGAGILILKKESCVPSKSS